MKIAALIVLSLVSPVVDHGQFGDLPPSVRAWFQRPPIAACCAENDGIPTDFDMKPDGYYVPVPWSTSPVRVPDDKLILNQGNPVGRAIIWMNKDTHLIRCFVPGAGG